MASIVPKANGTYLIRVSCGVDSAGKQISRSKTFKPSAPNLPYPKLNREIEAFVKSFEQELKSEEQSHKPAHDKITFGEFCAQFLEIKKNTLSPNTHVFYSTKRIRTIVAARQS